MGLPVMAAVAVRKKVVNIGHFSPCFLVADTQLYKRLCPSVRRVGPSVRGHELKSAKMSVLDGFLFM